VPPCLCDHIGVGELFNFQPPYDHSHANTKNMNKDFLLKGVISYFNHHTIKAMVAPKI
jgi:hypothetical protein